MVFPIPLRICAERQNGWRNGARRPVSPHRLIRPTRWSTVVPEPSTLLGFLVLGGAVIVSRRRRRI